MKVLGVSRVAISKIAKAEGWQSKPIANGAAHLHRAEDVREYRDHQIRTKLVKALGWHGRGLYRADDIDIVCPICGGFAVEWPPPPEISKQFMCLEGHEGEIWPHNIKTTQQQQ
jgi:hypothetical protein